MQRSLSFVLALVLVWTGGCATSRPPLSGKPPQRIGIVQTVGLPPAYNVPAKGGGAGAARGAEAGFSAAGEGARGGWPGGAVAVILMPFLVIGGAIVGAFKAEDAARVEEAEVTLKAALTTLKPYGVVRDHLIEVARKKTLHSLVGIHSPADTEGIDTVLELMVSKFYLRGDGPINPPFRIILGFRTRLIQVADGKLIHEETFESQSAERTFVEWAENDAQPLREAFDSVALKLANDIVARVLVPDVSGEPQR